MASPAEVEDQALWSSDSESSEDELEDELRVNMEFNFGEIHLDPENEEPEDELDGIDQGPDQPDQPQDEDQPQIEENEVEVNSVKSENLEMPQNRTYSFSVHFSF